MDRNEIKDSISTIVREILQLSSADEFDTSKSLIDGFGLDSLDLLDLAFHIEERFGVKIGANELSGKAKSELREEDMIDDNGYLTEAALSEIRANIPEIPHEKTTGKLRKGDIPRLLNVDVFARLVEEKLADKLNVKRGERV
jgi:acyl carrier protein